MKNTTICEVITGAIWKMDRQWMIGYIGCQDLFTECAGELEQTRPTEIEEGHLLQIQCQSSDLDSKTSQRATEISKNQDGEIRIPCSDENNQTTPIPNNPEEVHRPTWKVDVRSQQMFYCKIFVELLVFSSLTNMSRFCKRQSRIAR
nr:unnamed protein product [Fasciola hepatica]